MSNFTHNSIAQNALVGASSGRENRLMLSALKLNRLLNRWISRHRQRRQLAQLEPHLLSDIGLSREQVQKEVARPFWN